ncbi:hypothetical protein Tco_0488774 [Tanacetum coccineum]
MNDHMMFVYEALRSLSTEINSDQTMSDLAEARKKRKKNEIAPPKTPPGDSTSSPLLLRAHHQGPSEPTMYCKKQGISELTQKDLESPTYEIVKVFHPDVVHLQFQMEECHKLLTDQVDDAILRYNVSKPLPLGGDPGHVTIQPNFFFNKDLEYLKYWSSRCGAGLPVQTRR